MAAQPNASLGRKVIVAPAVGATAGVSMLAFLPIWLASALVHGVLIGMFFLVYWVTENKAKAGQDSPEVSKPIETKLDDKDPDLTNTDTGAESELPTQFPVDRIEEHSVPGQVNATEAIGILNAPEGPARTLPAPPGAGNTGTGLALPSADGGSGAMIGTPGGYAQGIFNAGGFGGRSGSTREKLLQEGGGNAKSEAAVARGLEWFAMHQAPDGHWSMNEYHKFGRDKPWPQGRVLGDCGCTGFGARNDVAGTAFGLLPFLASGQTHKPAAKASLHDYSKNVDAALKWLMSHQKTNGAFGGDGMYAHGLATIAMCEAYGLTNDPTLKQSAQRAVNYIVTSQDLQGGGWRYRPKQAGDMSVSGWQLMALKSGQMAGLSVPKVTMDKAEAFWASCEVRDRNAAKTASQSGKDKGTLQGFGYVPSSGATPTMTAVGLLGMQYMGTTPLNKDLLNGVEVLKKKPPSGRDPYYEYYATQVMHHMGGESWQFWNLGPNGNDGIRDKLIAGQDMGLDAKHVHQIGSWGQAAAHSHGRIMTTSLDLLTLEVYYRHLPLYRQGLSTVKEKE